MPVRFCIESLKFEMPKEDKTGHHCTNDGATPPADTVLTSFLDIVLFHSFIG